MRVFGENLKSKKGGTHVSGEFKPMMSFNCYYHGLPSMTIMTDKQWWKMLAQQRGNGFPGVRSKQKKKVLFGCQNVLTAHNNNIIIPKSFDFFKLHI
jgi:hypothetical protein